MIVHELIKDKKIKLTTTRISILELLKNTKKPLSYEDIKKDITMDKATFYRNILKFEAEGIVNAFESNDRKRYFELNTKPHAHFVCVNCNSVKCIKTINIDLPNHQINNVIINGICETCLLENKD